MPEQRAAEALREARCVPQLDEHDDEEAETFRGAARMRRRPLARVTGCPLLGVTEKSAIAGVTPRGTALRPVCGRLPCKGAGTIFLGRI